VTTGYTYTDTFGTIYTYNVDTNGAVTGYTSNYSGPGYSYTYNFDGFGNFNGYSHFDGTTTTTYDANWNVVSTVTVVSSNMVAILDAGGATIGYSVTDEWGTATNYALDQVTVTGYSYTYVDTWSNTTSVTTYDANWNYIGSETKDASGNVLYSSTYSYTNGSFSGYTYFDGVTTWTYDANWNLLSTSVDTTGMTPIYATPGDNTTAIVGYSTTDQWGTTTTYDTIGVMTGAHYSYTNWDGSISVTSYDANWNYLSSVTKDAAGNELYSTTYSYDVNGNFSGYSYFDGVTTYSYDANWNYIGSSVNVSGMTPIYATPGDNTTAVVGYSSIDQWGTTTTYDMAGNKTGSSYSYHDTWNNTDSLTTYDANGNYLSSVTKDAAGNVLYSSTYTYVGNTFAGYSYFDGVTTWTYDANWNLTGSSVSSANLILNSTGDGYYFTDAWGTTTHYALDSSTVTGYSYSYFDSWNNTTSVSTYDANWSYLGSVTKDQAGNVLYSNSYSYLNGVFNGYTYFDGATTWTYDANWNLTGSTVNTASMTPVYATPGDNTTAIVGYSYTDQWGTTTTYDTAGNKTGSNYTYTNWDNSTTVTTYDANGNYLSSETTDANGKVLYSSSYSYLNGTFNGYTYFDGQTTYTYDSNWNLTGSTVNTASMTAVYATPGDNTTAIVGYTSTDAWGTTTNYDVNGVKTGSSYSYYDSWNNSTSVTTYDANGNYLSSVTKDASGNVLYSSTYSYTNGNFSGYSYFDGVTTTVYDANWNFVSSTVSTASMTPIYATPGDNTTAIVGYSTTDQWGTTTTYDTAGNKTGSSYSYHDSWNNTDSLTTYDANGNYLSSVTTDASGNVLYSSTYTYSGNTFTGYSYFDGVTTTVYDANWNFVSSTVNTASMTPIYATPGDNTTAIVGYSTTDQWGTTTTYDTAGNKTGSSSSYHDSWNNTDSVTTYDANGNYLSSVTTDASGKVLYSSTYTYSGNTFTGYSYFDGVTTTVYDANWNFVSSSVNTATMTPIYATPGDNTTAVVGYSNTDQWGTTTYYDLAGVKTGYSYSYTNWDNSVSVTTYDANNNYLSSVTRDATGKLLYSTEYIYSGGVFNGYISSDGVTTWTYDANWNLVSTVVSTAGMTRIYATPGDNTTAIVGYSTTDQSGTTTYYDLNGGKTGSSYTYVDTWNNTTSVSTYDVNGNQIGYVTKDATGNVLYSNTYTYTNGVFSGYTTFDGVTTWTYDANWNLLSAVVSTAGMTPIYATPGDNTSGVVGYSYTDQWGTTNYYDTSGVKTGYSNSNTNWDNSVSVSKYDANNNYLGYETRDAVGKLLYSDTYTYVNGVFNGHVYFDGVTTTVYDANWNFVSSTVSTASMTPIYATPGDNTTAVVGYSYTDQWGTTTYYDTIGTKTGSSNTWTDPMSGNTNISTYDATGIFLGSVTKDAAGNVLYSSTYTYTNGVFAGYTYFDGVTTWTYDANWNLLTDVGPYPISMTLNSDGITIDFSEIAFAPTDPTAIAMTMLKNGDPAMPMNIVSFTGDGTASFTIHTNQTLAAGDWVLLKYTGTSAADGVRDAAGNVMQSNAPTGYGGSAEGSSADNVIDLSNVTIFSAQGGYDISGGLGNDTITGSAASDYIMGGVGADTMTGGAASGDHFNFVQDGSSLISYNGSTYSGAIDRITDFSSGDSLSMNVADNFAPGGMQQGLGMMSAVPMDGLATDQSYFMVQGNYSAGQFTVNSTTGTDTMVVYDSDATAGVSQSGVVLSGVTLLQLDAMSGSSDVSYIGGGGGTNPPPPTGDTTPPMGVDAWADGAGSFGMVFSENVTLNNPTSLVGLTAYHNGVTPMTLTGVSVNATLQNEVVATYSDAVQTGDFIVTVYDAAAAGYNLTDLAGNAASSAVVVNSVGMGGAAVGATVDMSQMSLPMGMPVLMRGNAGADNFTGTDGDDTIMTGRGADIIRAGGGADGIYLYESNAAGPTPARDTLIVGMWDSNRGQADWVYGFDASSADSALHDVLGLSSNTIAADVTNFNGTDVAGIASHSIASGIVTFYDQAGASVAINGNNRGFANDYLELNLTALGATVAYQGDTDGNGTVDTLHVFQDNSTQSTWNNPTVIHLNGVVGATLGTAAGANVVQVTDAVGPEVTAARIVGNSVEFEFSENVAIDPNSQAIGSILLNGNGTNITSGATAAGNIVTVSTNASIGATDYLLMNMGSNVVDASGHVSATAGQYAAIGGDGNSTINMSNASWGFYIAGFGGNDVLTGSALSDDIEGGEGADTITGGGGQDYIQLGEMTAATDTVVINVGDSTPAGGASDWVHDFDVTSAGAQDMLDLPSNIIAANEVVAGVTNANTGPILSHSITNGMISFDDAGTFGSALVVGDMTNWWAIKNYMGANIADGQTVATYIDMNGNGSYADMDDRLAVFQGNATTDIQVQLYDTMGVVTSLANALNGNSVTII